MPELPDISVYIEALRPRVFKRRLKRVRIANPFLLRTYDPPISVCEGRRVRELRRIGKRICFGFDNGCWIVLHLMIAGRLHWKPPGAGVPARRGLAAFDFESGTLVLTEEGSKRRASLHVVADEQALAALDPGGIEPLECSFEDFAAALTRTNRTLKRALTDPRTFSGIGNAYSDEILHRARLSPVARTGSLKEEDVHRIFTAMRVSLQEWTERLREETGDGFPEKVTAFRPEMAVHGKFGEPCPVCGSAVQRIRYADNETNYCPSCQTEGRVLADRSLSRLLKNDWPRSVEEWET
jgi:formamidopyrimidine-DNA glycosylase